MSASHAFEESIAQPASEALHSFFYPPVRDREHAYANFQRGSPPDNAQDDEEEEEHANKDASSPPVAQQRQSQGPSGQRHTTNRRGRHGASPENTNSNNPNRRRRRNPLRSASNAPQQHNARHGTRGATPHQQEFDQHFYEQQQQDKKFVEKFWTAYDDIIILSLFTQVGIVARLAVSTWFTFFDGVFSNDSPLFVNLPLNCLSCFLLGMLASGESLMEIIATRFSPPRLQQALHDRQLEARRKGRMEGGGSKHGNNNNIQAERDNGGGGGGGISRAASSSSGDEFVNLDGESDDGEGGSSDDGMMMQFDPDHQTSRQGPWLRRRRRRSRRRKRRAKRTRTDRPDRFWWEPPVRLDEELRDVQLLALERRIRQSKCLLLFPIKKEDVDVMEHYFDEGYRKDNDDNEEEATQEDGDAEALEGAECCSQDGSSEDGEEAIARREMQRVMDARLSLENDLAFEESDDPELARKCQQASKSRKGPDPVAGASPSSQNAANGTSTSTATRRPSSDSVDLHGSQPAPGTDLNQMVHEVSANVTENITRLQRANLADGWDVGTTPEAMSDDLMLGLRLGFCGALSSFSSWNSAMINLIRNGHIGDAFVGYMLGLQLPIVAYRFGQHVAVFCFIWRCRQETRRDERRGYGIRVAMNENSERDGPVDEDQENLRESSERETPSIRAVATALFIMALVTQSTSIFFYTDPESRVVALSLLFSPLGVIARWRLARYNNWRPTFPIGTFSCNILACALSGGLGTLLAGNPSERQRLVLVSFINGFGGTLSSVAAFIVEILSGIDPVLLRFDGAVYALLSIFWAMVVGFLFTASADWADETG